MDVYRQPSHTLYLLQRSTGKDISPMATQLFQFMAIPIGRDFTGISGHLGSNVSSFQVNDSA